MRHQYLLENIESKGLSFCNKNGINPDEVKNLFPDWRARNCKYFLTLCRIYYDYLKNKNYVGQFIFNINRLLLILAYSNEIDAHFTRTLDDINNRDYANDPKELSQRFLTFKKEQNALNHKVLKINDYVCRTDLIVKDNHEFYIVYDMLRNRKDTLNQERMSNYQPPQYNYINNIASYANQYEEEYKKAVEAALGEMPKENVGKYTIIPIHNFNESKNPEYSDYTTWCVTNDHGMYHDYTQERYGKAMFYFCLRNDYKNVKQNENEKERKALDDYGVSMFAVLVTEDNEIVQITSRWNHSCGGGDKVTNIIGLAHYLEFDPRVVIKYDGEEDDDYDEEDDYNSQWDDYAWWVENLWSNLHCIETIDEWGDNSGRFIVQNEEGLYNIREINDNGDPDNLDEKDTFLLEEWYEYMRYIPREDTVCCYNGELVFFDANDGEECDNDGYLESIAISDLVDYIFDDEPEELQSFKDDEFQTFKTSIFGLQIAYNLSEEDTICNATSLRATFDEIYDKCYDGHIIVENGGNKYIVNLSRDRENYGFFKIDELLNIDENGFTVKVGDKTLLVNHVKGYLGLTQDVNKIHEVNINDNTSMDFKEKVYRALNIFRNKEGLKGFDDVTFNTNLDNFCFVEISDKWNILNTETGEFLSNIWFDGIDKFNNNKVAEIYISNKGWNFINANGEIISKEWFDWFNSNFYNEISEVRKDGKWNFINTNYQILSNIWFDGINSRFNENGYAKVFIKDKGKFIIDTEGNLYNEDEVLVNKGLLSNGNEQIANETLKYKNIKVLNEVLDLNKRIKKLYE